MPKRTRMIADPEAAQVYGEPKYPERMNYVTSEEQRAAILAVSKQEGITLGEAQRRLIEEALDMREQVRKADEEFAATPEGQESCRPVAVGLRRVGNQLVAPRAANAGLTRAQLIAQERGEQE